MLHWGPLAQTQRISVCHSVPGASGLWGPYAISPKACTRKVKGAVCLGWKPCMAGQYRAEQITLGCNSPQKVFFLLSLLRKHLAYSFSCPVLQCPPVSQCALVTCPHNMISPVYTFCITYILYVKPVHLILNYDCESDKQYNAVRRHASHPRVLSSCLCLGLVGTGQTWLCRCAESPVQKESADQVLFSRSSVSTQDWLTSLWTCPRLSSTASDIEKHVWHIIKGQGEATVVPH